MTHSPIFSTSLRQRSLGRIHKHGGFGLIEVMVTLVILLFGLLGVASLLVKGVSNASASESMAKANQLAADMAERIRVSANPTATIVLPNDYVRSYGDPRPALTPPTTIALRDVSEWLIALDAQLPQGNGAISFDGPTRTVTIGVRWSNCQGTLSDSDQSECKADSASAFKSVTYELRL